MSSEMGIYISGALSVHQRMSRKLSQGGEEGGRPGCVAAVVHGVQVNGGVLSARWCNFVVVIILPLGAMPWHLIWRIIALCNEQRLTEQSEEIIAVQTLRY